MKMHSYLKSFVITLVLLSGTALLHAQAKYRMGTSQEFKVTGTSTLHDWEMESNQAKGDGVIAIDGAQIQEINALNISLPAKSLTSGNARMERLAYSSLEADKHPQIRFELTQVRNITASTVLAEGRLTIAGQTRPVTLRANYVVNGSSINFKGTYSIKFSQFEIDPPTALLGAVKTGDDLQLLFDVNFTNLDHAAR